MEIFLTALHSATNPQPGIGTARSLRAAFPQARLVGVDYSPRSSGIHWPDIDEVQLQRPWDEMHLPSYAADIRARLDRGGIWISGSDLESRWLADVFPGGHPRLLSPPKEVFAGLQKPAVPAATGLPVRIAPFVEIASLSDWDLHAFCRQHDWNLWLKGPYYDALRVTSWPSLENGRAFLSGLWSTEDLALQAHVNGHEESVCFCAWRGSLLGAVRMRKRDVTEIGKTWAGAVTAVSDNFLGPLRAIVQRLNYTGGGEVEMVRDAEGTLWLLEWNPRFPAWIHGATLAGTNLPALLVEAATGEAAVKTESVTAGDAGEFTRVVLEVPVRAGLPLPPLPEPLPGGSLGLKHPSGLLGLAKNLHGKPALSGSREEVTAAQAPPPEIPHIYLEDVQRLNGEISRTPASVYLPRTAADGFLRTAERVQALSTQELRVRPGYSIKTNPDERLLALAKEAGFFAEGITLLEIRKALACGFPARDCILNGPGKWHPDGVFPAAPLSAVFCDSLEDLQRVLLGVADGRVQTATVGVRLRPPQLASRFGIPVASPEDLMALVETLDGLPAEVGFGVHLHMASSHYGVETWWRLFSSTLLWCRSLEALVGRAITTLDLGGGWASDDWHSALAGPMARAVESICVHLPAVHTLVLEPGKALAGPAMAVAMRILEVKKGAREVVVDGSIADLPMAGFQPHRILHRPAAGGAWKALPRGGSQLQGRLCMEHDFVAHAVGLPADAAPGDLLIFCDAGGYDKSMSYVFGCG